jgi:hypothetical protein
VERDVASGRLVLASDALHFYKSLERDWPSRLFSHLEKSLLVFDRLRDLQARPGTAVVAGHAPRVTGYFATAVGGCHDLSAGPLFAASHFP